MKIIVIALILCIGLLTGCGDKTSPAGNDVVPESNPSGSSVVDDSQESEAETPEVQTPEEQAADPSEAVVDHTTVVVERPTGDLIEIKEKMFIAQTNDVYYNPEDYLGKTFKYEGIFLIYDYTDPVFYNVIRYGPGCCGIDSNAGFEVAWDGELPKHNDWVEVVGVLEEYELDGFMYLRLALSSIKVLPTRGLETVTQ